MAPLRTALLTLFLATSCTGSSGEDPPGGELTEAGEETTSDSPTTGEEYIPCEGDEDCLPLGADRFCFQERGLGVCSLPCGLPEECPESLWGEPVCAVAFLEETDQACLLSCLPPLECPEGLECLEYRGTLFCG